MAEAQPSPPNYLRLLWLNWRKILLAAAIAAIAAIAVVWTLPRSYESSVTLLVHPPLFKSAEHLSTPTKTAEDRSQIAELMPRTLPVEMYRTIARSDDLAQRVIDDLGLTETSVQQLRQRLEVKLVALGSRSPVSGTQYASTMLLHGRASSPELAARIVQRWAELFKEQADDVALADLDESFELLEAMWISSGEELDQAEEELAKFREEWNLSLLRALLHSKENQVTELEARLSTLDIQISKSSGELEALRQELAKEESVVTLFRSPPEEAYWLLSTGGSSEVDQETASQLGLNVEEVNPVYREARINEVWTSRKLLGLKAERELAGSTARRLRTEITALQKQIAIQEVVEGRLVRRAETFAETYGLLSEKLEKAKIALRNRTSDIKIVGQAIVAQHPIGTRRYAKVLVALLVGAILGAVYVIFEYHIGLSAPAGVQERFPARRKRSVAERP